MDKKKMTVFIDTNIFIIDLRYKRDINFNTNREFLDFIRHGKGITTIINLLEICGILSFNLNPQQILELFHYLPERYKIDIIPSLKIDSFIPEISVKTIIECSIHQVNCPVLFFTKKYDTICKCQQY